MRLADLSHPSGNGVGAGVERSVLRAAIHLVCADEQIWQDRGRFRVPRTHLDGFMADPARTAKMQTAGFLSMLHILADLGGPLPISPFALLHIILGRDDSCLVNTALWKRLDDELYNVIAPWLEYDGCSPVPVRDPRVAALMCEAINDVSVAS